MGQLNWSFGEKEDGPAPDRNRIHGNSEMARLVRLKDWDRTALGAISGWSWEFLAIVNALLSSPVPMFLYSRSECVTLYNDAAMPILSGKHPVALGSPASQVFSEAWKVVGPEIKRVLEQGTITKHEGVFVPLELDGKLQDLYWDYCYSPIFESNQIAGVLCVCQNVTAAVLAGRQRDAAATRLNEVLDSTTDSVISIDRDWRIRYMNPAARVSAGPLADAIGQDFWEAFPGAVYKGSPYLEHYSRAMDGGVAAEFEAFYPAPLDIWTRIQVRPTGDGIALFFRDVTEQKRINAALLQAEKLAAVGRLSASIAHEVNNPLESVTNLLYLARRSMDLPEVQAYLNTAERELRRVSVISNQTLRFYKQSTNPQEVRCDDLFESVLSIYQGRFVNSRIEVEKRKRAKRPVLCFDDEIRQVLSNLVGNAIDAMHPIGGRLLLRSKESTDWSTGRRGLSLTVADTGEGINPQVRKSIFDAFFTTKGIGGTGLGLWVSREIVQRHLGALHVRSSQAEGRHGTVFILFLPFDPAVR